MKKLTLLRHAAAERLSASGADFDRPLSARGRAEAAHIGQQISVLGLAIDRQLSSPATRAVETATLAGLAPDLEQSIYEASTGDLLALVQASDRTVETIMMVGHNPGLEQLASWLTGGAVAMPTGSLISIMLPIARWDEASGGTGRFDMFLGTKAPD